MRLLFIILYLLSFGNVSSQSIALLNDTSKYRYIYYEQDRLKHNVESVKNKDGEVIRIYTYGQLIEVSRVGNAYSGFVSFSVDNVDPSIIHNECYSKNYKVSSVSALSVFNLYDSLAIGDIPSDIYISDWKKNFWDPTVYVIEYHKDSIYTFKAYTEIGQTILESQLIDDFIYNVRSFIDYDFQFKDFKNGIPFHYYSFDRGFITYIKGFNNKEYREFRKRMRIKKRSQSN